MEIKDFIDINNFKSIVKEKPDAELLAMVYQFHIWDTDMMKEIETELKFRNLFPDDVDVNKKEVIEEEDRELSKGKDASFGGLITGWIFVMGFLGVVFGYNYAFSKSRSKYTGKVYYNYNEASRKNGTNLFYTSLAFSILFILYKIIKLNGTSI